MNEKVFTIRSNLSMSMKNAKKIYKISRPSFDQFKLKMFLMNIFEINISYP